MVEKIAVFIDGGFIKKKLKGSSGESLSEDIVNHCNNLLFTEKLKQYRLLRIYYYDALPYEKTEINPISKESKDFSKTKTAKNNKRLIESLEVQPNFAVRKGTILFQGWKLGDAAVELFLKGEKSKVVARDLVPNLKQKQVDLKIALDIAWLSSKRLVDAILLISGDSDFIPAMKYARKEGIRVYLNSLHHPVKKDLKIHTDDLVELKL
jgi:uncharacterized LabA/DUF88 family protein